MIHIVYIHAPVEDERGLIGRVNEEQGVNGGEVFVWRVVATYPELDPSV